MMVNRETCDRQSRINTNDLKTRLDAAGMDRGSFSPEELTEFW